MFNFLTKFKLKKIEHERLALLSNWTVEDVNYDDWSLQKTLDSKALCVAIAHKLEELDEEKRELLEKR